jgi:hypothetical protein
VGSSPAAVTGQALPLQSLPHDLSKQSAVRDPVVCQHAPGLPFPQVVSQFWLFCRALIAPVVEVLLTSPLSHVPQLVPVTILTCVAFAANAWTAARGRYLLVSSREERATSPTLVFSDRVYTLPPARTPDQTQDVSCV